MNEKVYVRMKSQMIPKQETVDELFEKIDQLEIGHQKTGFCVRHQRGIAMAIAAVLVVCILSLSPMGTAIAEQITAWMQPQNVTESIEGSYEKNLLSPVTGNGTVDDEPNGKVLDKTADYVIYVNDEFFKTKDKNGVQIISALSDSKAKMTITVVNELDWKQCLQEQIKKNGLKHYESADVLGMDYANKGIYYTTGSEWNDTVRRIYCIDNEEGGCITVKTVNTVEEEEGYGTRFINMLETIKLHSGEKDR